MLQIHQLSILSLHSLENSIFISLLFSSVLAVQLQRKGQSRTKKCQFYSTLTASRFSTHAEESADTY